MSNAIYSSQTFIIALRFKNVLLIFNLIDTKDSYNFATLIDYWKNKKYD